MLQISRSCGQGCAIQMTFGHYQLLLIKDNCFLYFTLNLNSSGLLKSDDNSCKALQRSLGPAVLLTDGTLQLADRVSFLENDITCEIIEYI